MSHADIYARQSQDRDKTGAATSRQVEDAEKLCQMRGWIVGEKFIDDDVSAAGRKHRDGFERLLAKIKEGRVAIVVAWSIDRVTRNRKDTVRFIEACRENKVMVALCRGSDMDMATPAGLLMADMLTAIARNEIEVKSDRQRRAHEQSAEQGRPPMRRAFGYNKDGSFDDVEADAVRHVFEQFIASGSVSAIVTWLAEHGHQTTTGKPWDRASVRKLLRNVRYCGIRVHRGLEVGPGLWPPIVDEDTVRDAIALLADPERRKTFSTARKWLGSRLYRCGRCSEVPHSGQHHPVPAAQSWSPDSDLPHSGQPATGDRQRVPAAYPYTLTVTYDHGRTREYRCEKCWMVRKADPIDAKVLGLIRARLARPDVADVLAGPDVDVAGMRTQRRALMLRLDALADDIELDERTLLRRTKALRDRLLEIDARLGSAAGSAPLKALADAADPTDAFASLDIVGQQRVVDHFAVITVMPGRGGEVRVEPRSFV